MLARQGKIIRGKLNTTEREKPTVEEVITARLFYKFLITSNNKSDMTYYDDVQLNHG